MYILNYRVEEFNHTVYVLRPKNLDGKAESLKTIFNAIPNSQYEDLVFKTINLILYFGKNLSLEYELFFQEEYPNFYSFLLEEKGFVQGAVDQIKSHIKTGEALWEVSVSDYEGYNFARLITETESSDGAVIETLNRAIGDL